MAGCCRWGKQVVGVDANPVEIFGILTESNYKFTGLPDGKTVNVTIVPVNPAGDGPASAAAEIVVP